MRISDWSSDVCSSDLEAAAAVAALVAAVAGLHDDGGTFIQRFDAHRQIADDVVAEAQVALQLVHRRRRGVDAQHDVVALAVLLDAVGQGAQTHVLGRSAERRVGTGCGSTCRSRRSTYNYKKKTHNRQQT